MPVFWLTEEHIFPHPELANEEGILAIGGDLHPERLLLAYQNGIFPWYSPGEPIIWWSPDPRFVLFPQDLKVSKSMKQILRKNVFKITINKAFREVMRQCQKTKRKGQAGTWITDEMIASYAKLHWKGIAHSVEVWEENELVGGLYGVSFGKCFFGESMFSHKSNASKAGFLTLVKVLEREGFALIDCQVHTDHLESLGAGMISRKAFLTQLETHLSQPFPWEGWTDLEKHPVSF
ncbi:MAG: leucyl/phenylalanyl-tRNA--protein transferase [Bacteroidota bacterium]